MILCARRTRRCCSTGYFRSISRPAASDSSPDSSRACAVTVGRRLVCPTMCRAGSAPRGSCAAACSSRLYPGAEVRAIGPYRDVDRGVHPAAVAFASLRQNHLLAVELLWVQRKTLDHCPPFRRGRGRMQSMSAFPAHPVPICQGDGTSGLPGGRDHLFGTGDDLGFLGRCQLRVFRGAGRTRLRRRVRGRWR